MLREVMKLSALEHKKQTGELNIQAIKKQGKASND
jgi:hypothetical protein